VGPALMRRHQAQALREARDQAEAGARTKSAFLATMSHEIRTPLNGVMGVLDLLKTGNMDADQKQLIDTASQSASSLLAIINDILDFSRLEAGKLGLDPIPVAINEIVDGVAETLAINAGKKGLRLRSFVNPAMPARVIADPARLRQILFNLLGNAIKFTNRGEVAVRADWLAERGDAARRLRIVVADTGIGLDLEQQAKLFKPFSQADASTSRRYGGTGLGLAICSMLVQMMGGVIGVSSKPGKGASFYVELAAEVDTPAPESARSAFAGVRCLILDRSKGIRRLLSRYLEYWGAEAHTAENLEDALTVLDRARAEGLHYGVIVAGEDAALEEQLDRAINLLRTSAGEPGPGIAGPRFIVLRPRILSGRRASDAPHAPREADGDVFNVDRNPVRRAAFAQAVAAATWRESPELDVTVPEDNWPERPAPSIAEAATLGELILLAEDNDTNRKLLVRQLNQIGYAVEAVENGKQALALWREGRHGLLLTDCQMPEMDGYMLAEAIRAEEPSRSGTRLPIIAATASAQHDDAKRCFAAGMDDYVTKPLDMKALRGVLKRWLPRSAESTQSMAMADTQIALKRSDVLEAIGGGARPATAPTAEGSAGGARSGSGSNSVPSLGSDLDWTQEIIQASGSGAAAQVAGQDELGSVLATRLAAPNENAIDPSVLKRMLGNDPETIAELLRDFVASSDVIASEVETGVRARSADAVRSAVHKLKSSARAVGAMRVAELSVALEQAGKATDWDAIMETASTLRDELRRVSRFVNGL
ncbi:MAG: response regulator, partial [Gammaproteobacteria bacterium]